MQIISLSFFFSSRRRHTRYWRDWSSDVCSSDLIEKVGHKNAITRAVGVYERVDVDTLMIEVLPGDAFLLASDGLTGYLERADELVPFFQQDGDAAVKALVEHAKTAGGKDNITVVIVG